ncbi:MAG TPA: organomercurial lyase [Pilimelia sp.]|nr:organomercurial lyase [Pilimelia sp.]
MACCRTRSLRDLATRLHGTETQLDRVVRNLLDNAVRYARTAVTATVEVAGEVVLTVADDGPGIPAADRERVLERSGGCPRRTRRRIWDDPGVDLEGTRLAVYRSFARTGRPPHADDLAAELTTDGPTVRAGLRELARTRHLVLAGADEIIMAHPFSAVPLGFAVMGRRTLWWGGCAWDSFALPHLLPDEGEVLVSTRCPACARPHAVGVGGARPPDGGQVAHFLVPAAHMWDDVVHTCRHQRLFCSAACVDDWCRRSGSDRGYVMDLHTLWRLAARWYDGRLDRGYVRREPAAAKEYLRSVGLSGPFWGL